MRGGTRPAHDRLDKLWRVPAHGESGAGEGGEVGERPER